MSWSLYVVCGYRYMYDNVYLLRISSMSDVALGGAHGRIGEPH